MALASTLPIYRVTYELLQVVTRITKDMPRDYKQSLGAKIREEFLNLAWQLECERSVKKHGY
jgi:hypothetical protein